MTARAFVCRCEDVTVAEVERSIAAGLSDIEEIKRYTGLGTGPCQGKECLSALACLLVARGLVPADRLRPFTARPPVEPVTFGILAAGAATSPTSPETSPTAAASPTSAAPSPSAGASPTSAATSATATTAPPPPAPAPAPAAAPPGPMGEIAPEEHDR